jgi:putative FmdB family regulatory protein
MKPLHDYRCNDCGHTFEYRRQELEGGVWCPTCGGSCKVVFLSAPRIKAGDYDPYDALNRVIPDSKPIKSFANDRRKGGKDRT